jgi:hypothetical protein
MNQNQHIIIIISKTGNGWFSDFEIVKKLELVIINNIQYMSNTDMSNYRCGHCKNPKVVDLLLRREFHGKWLLQISVFYLVLWCSRGGDHP